MFSKKWFIRLTFVTLFLLFFTLINISQTVASDITPIIYESTASKDQIIRCYKETSPIPCPQKQLKPNLY